MKETRKFKNLIAVFIFCSVLILGFNFNIKNVFAASGTGIVTGSDLNVRTGPNSTIIALLDKGDNVTVINTVQDSSGGYWYEIEFTFGTSTVKKGYVSKNYVTLNKTIYSSTFETYLDQQGFPESYRAKLRELHKLHDKWVFKAKHVGLNWANVLYAETSIGKNLVPSSSAISWKSLESGAYNWASNTWHGFDGSWVAASKEITSYFLDPRNFLEDTYIFQFQNLAYCGTEAESGVESILSGTFMSSPLYVYADANNVQHTVDFSKVFMSAAVKSGVSPYNLAVRARQEQGIYGSQLAKGYLLYDSTTHTYKKYFNYFNFGAVPGTNNNSLLNGAVYAQRNGWTSPELSITGGAGLIADNYINVGQNTLYLQKFDVVDGGDGYYCHQYMTNLQAAYSESSSMSKAYSGIQN
ncbi:MAG: SH3 domain-containing protein, partial [Clostridiaceae bacterium]